MDLPESIQAPASELGAQPNLWRQRLVLIGAGLAVALASFEIRAPLVTIGPVSFTTSEVAALLFFVAAAWWMAADWRDAVSRRVLDLPVAIFLLSNFMSTMVAADKAEALKFSLRMTFAALIYLGISRLPSRSRSHLVVAGAFTGSLLMVTFVGLLENFVTPVDWPYLLSPWQEVISTFGTFYNLRVASTMPFPTVLSMFLELTFPLGLAFGIWFTTRKRTERPGGRFLSAALLIALAGIMAVQVLTYTRSAIVAVPLSLLTGASLAWVYGYGRRVVVYFLLGAAMLIVFLGGSVVFSNKMATRLGVSEQEKTYSAAYQILTFPDSILPGKEYSARVRVTNTSDLMWYAEGSDRTFMVYRWLDYPERSDPEFPYLNTDLPHDVKQGETLDMDVRFAVPAGARRYVLVVELVKYSVGWFSDAGVPPVFIPLDLTKTSGQRFEIPEASESFIAAKPIEIQATRTELWRAALNIWKGHPVLGVGPGQFRKVYPAYLPEARADQRLESHNIFLEAAANTGTLGLAAMVFLLGAAVWTQVNLVRSIRLPFIYRLLALALLCAMVAYVVHGFLDFFLWQTGIAFTFFAELGLTAWLAKTGRPEDAG